MNELQLKLCDIQGRLFELSAEKKYNSAAFIKAFMMSDTAKELDSTLWQKRRLYDCSSK